MANPFAAIGNFFSDIGKGAQQVVSDIGGAISEGFSNLTGGGGSNNKPQPAPTPTPTPTPTSSSTSSGGGGSYTPSTSSGGSNNTPSRSNSAGAQALNQQITSQPETPKPTITGTQSEPTTGTPTIISGSNAGEPLTPDIITPSKPSPSDSAGAQALNEQINSQSETPKPTITGVQTEPVTGIPTILAGSQAGNILPETIITPNKPSTGDSAGALGLGEQISQTLKPTITGTQKEPTVGIPTVLVGSDAGKILGDSMITSSKPEKTSFGGVTSNDINFGLINSGLMTGITSGISNLFGGTNGDTKKPVAKSSDNSVGKGVDTIYRDDDLVGIHYFDSKAESEAFLKELYPEGDFDWGEPETGWYDPKTGEYLGYLGEEAYPYAIIVPETYDAPIRLEFATGGSKGGSPVKDTGKTTWADVPSALTRMELRDAGFDYGFSSRNLDTQELMNQSEMRGYDSSWYDGKIGQNIGLYDAEKGGYDARTSNISVADVRAGKVSADVLGETQGGKAILEADKRVIPTIDENVSAYMAQEGIIKPAEQDIRAYYTIDDAVKRGVDKAGGYWYEDNPVVSGIFGGLDTAAEGISQFSSDLKAGKLPVANFLLGATNPLASGISALSNTVTKQDNISPMVAGTTWGLGVVEGALRTPKSIASLDENIKAARSELGDEALVGLATPAALGMSNILANYYKDNPTDAFFDAATLVTGGAGIASKVGGLASKVAKGGKITTNVDGVDVEFSKPKWDMSGIEEEIKNRNAFEKEMAKAEKANVKEAKQSAKAGDKQSAPKYSEMRGYVNPNVMDDIWNYNVRNQKTTKAYDDSFISAMNDKGHGMSLINRDIDNLIKADGNKATGLSLFDDRRDSSLIVRDRDRDLPALYKRKDRDSNALILRDMDKPLVIRDKDKNIPYTPKDRNVPPVRKDKDNKILPFLDDLAGLLDGKDTGGLSGGMYGGRGRGRSWKVYNEDITDASQFSGLF